MKRRPGTSCCRIIDSKRWTLVLDRNPKAGMYLGPWLAALHTGRTDRPGRGRGRGYVGGRTFRVMVPGVTWRWAYDHRRLGGLVAYRLNARVVRWITGGAR